MAQELSQAAIKAAFDSQQSVIKNWPDLHLKLSKMTDSAWIFRGVSATDHYPQPSIGREKQYGPYKLAQEKRLFRAFKDRAIALAPNGSFDDWQWLAYAQHLGVPTRLLDWSISPLIATFFSICSDSDSDRLIYCAKYSTYVHEVDAIAVSPFENTTLGRFSPPLAFERLRWQRGVFTIHPDPTKIFYRKNMKVLRIPNTLVHDFRKRLFKYGIDFWHIYPDFDGLGQQLRWQFKNKVGLGSLFMDKS